MLLMNASIALIRRWCALGSAVHKTANKGNLVQSGWLSESVGQKQTHH